MFTYTALPDATKQIRLLSFDASTSETHLSIHLRVHDMAGAPEYHAVSYCYGDPSLREKIVINGHDSDMNRAGWHALQQARSQGQSNDLFWLDAICINQSDLQEKSLQVGRISGIFRRSFEVFACLGSHSDDSEFLVSTLTTFPLEKDPEVSDRLHEVERRTMKWMWSLKDDFKRFSGALEAFGHRPFFTRIWIYQEMFLAPRVKMICGTETFNLQSLRDIDETCSGGSVRLRGGVFNLAMDFLKYMAEVGFYGMSYDIKEFLLFISDIHEDPKDSGYRRFASFLYMQEDVQKLRCQDPRDMVFAIIGCFRQQGIVPDYQISCFGPALQVLSELSRHKLTFRNFHLENSVERLEANLGLQERIEMDYPVAESEDDDLTRLQIRTDNPAMLRDHGRRACQVAVAMCGDMTAPFCLNPLSKRLSQAHSNILVVDQRPVAIATCDFAIDDWIVPLDYFNDFGLVLRSGKDNVYDIIGEAAFFAGCIPCISRDSCGCQFGQQSHAKADPAFDIFFDCEEFLTQSTRHRQHRATWQGNLQPDLEGWPPLPASPHMQWDSSFAVRNDQTPINQNERGSCTRVTWYVEGERK